MFPNDFFNSPNLFVPVVRSLIISTVHLLPISWSVISTGQADNYFDIGNFFLSRALYLYIRALYT